MAKSDRTQVLIWGALAVAIALVGARWVSSGADAGGSGSEPARASDSGIEIESGGDGVLVHVAGSVRSPGVYRLPGEARVVDAIERAGGTSSDAARDAINLAARLADGQQVVVPSRRASAAARPGAPEAEGPISLGTATQEQLESIDGIGPVTASKIIGHRDERGGIASIEELGEIHGIGPATLEALSGALQP